MSIVALLTNSVKTLSVKAVTKDASNALMQLHAQSVIKVIIRSVTFVFSAQVSALNVSIMSVYNVRMSGLLIQMDFVPKNASRTNIPI